MSLNETIESDHLSSCPDCGKEESDLHKAKEFFADIREAIDHGYDTADRLAKIDRILIEVDAAELMP